ncbi:MAG: hypothetical protein JWQ81_5371 [Amycolatopsis sp.]|jgi:hypothetical protein|uniref:transcriptional regulator n=1 Tax=Amycolatopsis sp. TaxID=37632 RepID=UPI00261F06CD|nr:transcriptional regulator [Amycolatopsis sp.]MCU1684632.1 hypothetical protein [Amycolatopsis sp.]
MAQQERIVTTDYGRPPRAAENQSLVETRLKEALGADGARETLTVDWRGQPAHFDVIHLPVGNLYYNPATHRVRAQRSHDPAKDTLLDVDPWSPQSQEYLDHLLKALPADPSKPDPEFEGLAESLKEYGQSDPGLVTRDGIIVNGNTRRAALLQISGPAQSMRLAVLPESCSWTDITNVELSLQLRRDHRRDYSYINRLLAIDELVVQGVPLGVIAATFRTTVASCKQDQWVLSCVRSMIERSEAQGIKLSLLAFEERSERLKELHRRYMKDLAVDSDKAELTKESRLAAIMLDYAKTDVRLIEPEFQSRYLAKVIPEELRPHVAESAPVAIPGLGRSVKGASQELAAAKALTDSILKAKAVAESSSSLPSAVVTDASQKWNSLREAMGEALEPAGKDERIRKRKQAAPGRLLDACQDIDQCVTDLVLSRGTRSLDEESFDEAVLKLKESLRTLALETRRTIAAPGDGVNWLLEALTVRP